MEKQLHAKSSTHSTYLIDTFDRFFTKARGVELFPEEKTKMLNAIERTRAATAPIQAKTRKEEVAAK